MKSFDEFIQFIFITGVSKFHKVSVFSDLNQLNDISLDREYACLCGITKAELRDNFEPEIEILSERKDLTPEECLKELKRQYSMTDIGFILKPREYTIHTVC